MAQVNGEIDPARHHIGRPGPHPELTDGGDAIGCVGQRRIADAQHQVGGALQGVAAQRHRRGAGMGGLAARTAFEPAHPLSRGHHPDGVARYLQHRPLLDMELQEAVPVARRAWRAAAVADPLQRIGEGAPLIVTYSIRFLLRHCTGIDRRGHGGGAEARAFFVGPVDDFDRTRRLDAPVVERAHHFEAGQHAEHAIETATGRLGVQVAAGRHGRQVIPPARAPREHVAHSVDVDAAARLLAPAPEQVAAGAVLVGQRLPVAAAPGGGADLRHQHQALPESFGVYGIRHGDFVLSKP